MPHTLVKPAREDTIPVVDEKAVGMISRNRCTQLLEGPRRCGLYCDIGMQNPARGMFYDHKHIEEAKGHRDHHAEVKGHNALGMNTHKGPPALRWYAVAPIRVQTPWHIFAHGPGGHAQTELH